MSKKNWNNLRKKR